MENLKNENLINEKGCDILLDVVGPNKQILERQLNKQKGTANKHYAPELRRFALNLNFLSPKAATLENLLAAHCHIHELFLLGFKQLSVNQD